MPSFKPLPELPSKGSILNRRKYKRSYKKMVKWCNRVANLKEITKEMKGFVKNDEGWTIDTVIGKDKAVLYITLKKYLITNNWDISKFNILVKKRYRFK